MKQVLIIFLFLLGTLPLRAQEAKTGNNRPLLRQGNLLYNEGNYAEAQSVYQKALGINNINPIGYFNHGDALMQNKKYEEARKQFQAGIQLSSEKDFKAKSFHNIGNSFVEEKKWEEAIDAYKKSLRLNPNDQDTKYNLAYAQKMLKKDGGGGGGKDKDKDKNKDKDKDQDKDKKEEQDKEKDKNGEDKKDHKNDQGKPDEQPQQPKPQQGELSPKEAENILDALNQYEKHLQKEKGKEKGVPVRQDKDW